MKLFLNAFALLISLTATADMRFFKDKRPVDGIFAELTITSDSPNTNSIVFKEMYYSRQTRQNVSTVQHIATEMDCVVVNADELQTIVLAVDCTKDTRSIDGLVTVVSVLRNESGTYDASLYSSVTDLDGSTSTTKLGLANDLELVNP
jgi:hypothetical protein